VEITMGLKMPTQKLKKSLIAVVASMLLASCAATKAPTAFNEHPTSVLPNNAATVMQINGRNFSLKEYETYLAKNHNSVKLKDFNIDYEKPKKDESKPEVLYSFNAKSMRIKKALGMFASHNHLNIVTDKDIKGTVSVNIHGVPLKKVLKYILDPSGYYATIDGNVIYVRDMEDAIVEVNYPRFSRDSRGSVNSSGGSGSSSGGSSGSSGGVSSGASGSSSSGASGGSTGSASNFNISSSDSINFLAELEQELEKMVSKGGSVSINRLSGVIHIHDHHRNVVEIKKYLEMTDKSIHRQVSIVATIMLVDTSDSNEHGVDWNLLAQNVAIATATAIKNPIGVATGGLLSPSVNATIQNTSGKINSVVSALKQQGKVNIISKPHLRTINNQPALIKVGTDRTFFRIQSSVNATTAGTTTTVSDIPQNITEGLVMSITPQISKDGLITLNIDPVITSLNGTDVSVSGSVAPRLDVKQLSSVVSIRSGQSVVIGGLVENSDSDEVRSVPMLGDIPFIGGIFSTTQHVKQVKELVIILTPYVVE